MSIRLGSCNSLVKPEFNVHFFLTEVGVVLLLLMLLLRFSMFLAVAVAVAVAAAVAKPSKAASNCRNDYYYSQNNKH